MNPEAGFPENQKFLNESLQKGESKDRLLRYVQILMQINNREKIVNIATDD